MFGRNDSQIGLANGRHEVFTGSLHEAVQPKYFRQPLVREKSLLDRIVHVVGAMAGVKRRCD